MTQQELKPCPRCGSAAVLDDGCSEGIHCDGCGYWTGEEMTRDEAAIWWNEQPLVEALQAALAARDEQIAELRRQLAEAQRWMPVEDSFEYKCQCADCLEDAEWQWQLYANRDTIGICDVHGDGDRYIYLPANIRLCRQVAAQQIGE